MLSANAAALKENLVSKEHVETLTEFQAKVDQAKMDALQDDETEVWVETSEAICNYYNRKSGGLGRSGYFDYQGDQRVAVKVCPYGKSEEIKARLARQIDQINHPGDGVVGGATESRAKAGTV